MTESQTSSPPIATVHSSGNAHAPAVVVPDAGLVAQVVQQAQQIDEQAAIIETLNEQLAHYKNELRVHMDLVAALKSSLSNSEENLRTAKMQADTLNESIEAQERRLDEERRGKERVRQQLDVRMAELQKRKSKFACL
ncbi:hypothetical protein BD779DRAFT_929645 [Infundibulicybe gibba]|nr:hypothetical protein BD779DRAFT_929645 [Infundibulicybe gibba]